VETTSVRSHPPESEVLSYFERYSNWGRWGPDDEAGTLNHITAEHRVRAARLVQDGVTVSCSKLLSTDININVKPPLFCQPTHFMLQCGEQFAHREQEPYVLQTALDYFGVAFHNVLVTHLDAVGHVFWDGKQYNGVSPSSCTSAAGATVQSIDVARNGIVSRGVLLDIPRLRGVHWLEPGDAIFADELEAAERAQGVRVEAGDVLLVRTGAGRRVAEEGPWDMYTFGVPGLSPDCIPFIHDRGVAVLGSDGGSDVFPNPYELTFQPIHQVGLVALGLWLIDFCTFEDLTVACEERARWEFLFTMGPLRIEYGTGCPINPIAVL
jgi:kynurenine formamidase